MDRPAEAFSCRTKTVVRRNFVEEGRALERKRTPPVPKILDGEAEARVIALYEGQHGYANWSLRLLAGKVVELGDKSSNGDADAKKRLLLQKKSPVLGDSARKRSSRRNKCLKEKPYEPSGGLHGRAAGAVGRGADLEL